MGSLTKGGYEVCQGVLFPGRDFCVGVWRDGNELNGLLRIRKCHKAERQVFTVDMVSFSVPRKTTNRVTFLWMIGNTAREKAEVKDW